LVFIYSLYPYIAAIFAATLSKMKGLILGKMGLETVITVIHSFVNGGRVDTAGKRVIELAHMMP